MVDKLNRIYNQQNNTTIGFYMKCEPTYINNSQHLIKTFVGASLLMATNRDLGCINVHVVDRLQFAAGMTLKPLGSVIVNRATYLRDDNYTLPHEVGHALGLIHTHIFWDWQIKCFRECVSRTRTWPTFNLCFGSRIRSKRVCESTGDGLGDTQADPRLLSNFSCDYIPQGGLWATDLWGDSHSNPPNGPQEIPNTHNIMSYEAMDACVDQISRLQIGVMLYNLYIINGADGLAWQNPIHTFDSYEPDNNAEQATTRNISINEVQDRNFHQQYNNLPGVPVPFISQCDVDWVRFIAPCSGNFSVLTSAMPNRTPANTQLTLFDNTLTQLAQNNDISGVNQFSNIDWNFISGQVYFIRVENLSIATTGYYRLQVGSNSTITGPPSICTSENYTIPGIAGTGATVSWSVSPTNLTTAPYTGTGDAFNVTRDGSATGTITLTATITSICSANPVVINRTITIGGAGVSLLSSQGNCNGTVKTWSLSTTPPSNGSNWQWTVDFLGTNSSIYIYNPNAPSTYVDVTGGGTVKLTYTDLCGTTRTDGVTVYSNCRSGFGFAITPNPAQDNVKVSSDNQTLAKSSTANLVYAIKITDRFGIIRKSFEYKPGIASVNISVSDLNSGLYLIAVFDGTNWSNQQLVVQK